MKLALPFFLFMFPLLATATPTVERDIRSFGARGDGKTNDHAAFQKAAAFFNARGGNGKLVITKGVYIVGRQIFNRNNPNKPVFEGQNVLEFKNIKNLQIEGRDGAIVRYTKNLRFGAFEPVTGKPYIHGNNYFVNAAYLAIIGSAISFSDCSAVAVKNLNLDGNSDGIILGGVYGDVGYQVPHTGISVFNSSGVTLDSVYAHHFGQDGLYVSNATGESKILDKILIQNCRSEYNGRQGLSWVGGNDLRVVNSKFNHTGRGKIYSAPGAGVDIEAEVGTIQNGRFEKCEFINNTGNGLVADSGPSSNCTFTDCLFWGVTSWSVWITKPRFTFQNSTFHGSFVHGYDASTDAEATKFFNCLFEDKAYQGKEPFGTFLIETNYKRRLLFSNCTMIAHKKKIVWMESDPALKPEEKYQLFNCQLIFRGGIVPDGNWVSLTRNIRYKNCRFEMFHPQAERFYYNGIGESYNVDLGGNRYFKNSREIKI